MSKHKPGDMVKVNMPASIYHGQICVVLTGEELFLGDGGEGYFLGHEVTLSTGDRNVDCVAYEPHELIPISRLTVDELADAKEVA